MKELMKDLFRVAVRLLYAVSVFFILLFSAQLIWQKGHPEGIFMATINVKKTVTQLVIYSLIFIVLTIRFVKNKKKSGERSEQPWNIPE